MCSPCVRHSRLEEEPCALHRFTSVMDPPDIRIASKEVGLLNSIANNRSRASRKVAIASGLEVIPSGLEAIARSIFIFLFILFPAFPLAPRQVLSGPAQPGPARPETEIW